MEVEGRLSHFWSESYGHVYPMLRRLHDRGLVVKDEKRQEGRPARHVYHLTEEGRRALADWFAAPPSPLRPRNELLLRIFLGRHAGAGHLIRDVREFRRKVGGELGRLRDVRDPIGTEAGLHPDRMYWD